VTAFIDSHGVMAGSGYPAEVFELKVGSDAHNMYRSLEEDISVEIRPRGFD
jgi:hypothetical protein